GFSPDGFRWTAYDRNPVLPTWPEGHGKPTRHGVGDIVDVAYDPLNRHYMAAVKVLAVPEDGYAPGPRAGSGIRRLVGLSTSRDFVRWERPRRIFAPDGRDEGLLEFYGMAAMHVRGGLHIGLVRVLRDDLPCDPGGRLTLNARAARGAVTVRLMDAGGTAPDDLGAAGSRPVRLEFPLRRAALFGFEFQPGPR